MSIKAFFSVLAICLTFITIFPYIRAVLSGAIKPHIFSWFIWTITTFIIFFAQLQSGAGAGAWAVGASAGLTGCVAILAYCKKTDVSITTLDWIFLITALSALPLWYVAADPVWAVIILTTVDVLGFGPTIRKSYIAPYSESLLFFALFVVRNVLILLALERYIMTTVFFPLAMLIVCLLFIIMLYWRRTQVMPNSI